MNAPDIAVLDYGMGNLRSVEKAFEHVGARVERTSDPVRAGRAAGLVLPGVGAFPKAMREVAARGFDDLVCARVAEGAPVLGICLGMQLLFERSTELGGAEGLGVLEGEVRALEAPGLKLPQIGWNAVGWRRSSRLTDGLPNPCAFYHVHSFAAVPADPRAVVGVATYGAEFVSVVERENVSGVQFHPEKSGPDGLALLRNFARTAAEGPRTRPGSRSGSTAATRAVASAP